MNPNAAGNAVPIAAVAAALVTGLRVRCLPLFAQNVELKLRSHSVQWKVGRFTAKNASKDNGPLYNTDLDKIYRAFQPGFLIFEV